MAIVLVESPDQVIDKENQIKELENTKTDSRLLALDDEYMQVMIITVIIVFFFLIVFIEDQT